MIITEGVRSIQQKPIVKYINYDCKATLELALRQQPYIQMKNRVLNDYAYTHTHTPKPEPKNNIL